MIEVSIGPKAQAVIDAELERAKRDIAGGWETGGWLWAERGCAWWGGLEIVEASGPGPDDVRSYGAMTLMTGYLHDLDEMFRRDGLECVGGWHVHPSGDTMPSSGDVDAEGRIAKVLSWREGLGCRTVRALELIYAPRRLTYGVSGFTAEAWAFYRGTSRTGSPMLKPDLSVLVKGA